MRQLKRHTEEKLHQLAWNPLLASQKMSVFIKVVPQNELQSTLSSIDGWDGEGAVYSPVFNEPRKRKIFSAFSQQLILKM